jgi:hypothetical protein
MGHSHAQEDLQDRPEAPSLWAKHISHLIRQNLGFKSTTHKLCLCCKQNPEDRLIIVLRQVDDLKVSTKTIEAYSHIGEQTQQLMTNKLSDLCIIKRFNGVNVEQTKHYIKLHCETYRHCCCCCSEQ